MVAQAIGMLADAGATYLGDAMSEMIVRLLAEEKVPNVKFNAAWAAGKMGAARVGDIESIRAALTVRAPPAQRQSRSQTRRRPGHLLRPAVWGVVCRKVELMIRV